MKKLNTYLIALGILILSGVTGLQAQTMIPSFDAVLEQGNLVFIEENNQTNSFEERKINIKVEDRETNQVLPIVVEISTVDGLDNLGTYTVSENNPLELEIAGTELCIEVISYTAGTELSLWIE